MSKSHVVIKLDEVTNSCFVVMPFQQLFGKQYDRVIKPAIEAAGLECIRGDEIYSRQSIVEDIWLSLRRCRVVVAELSGRNPNVMYEIGLAHAIGKPIVLLTRSEEDVPFDLRSLRFVFYDTNDPFWGTELQAKLTHVLRLVLEKPDLATHLQGIEINTKLPDAPTEAAFGTTSTSSVPDLSGVWQGSWRSISADREHRATIIIPIDHGSTFSASMTVTYYRLAKQTIIEETLTATVVERAISLIGVNYTYILQGASSSYSLDNFNVRLSDDGSTLTGKAMLKNGVRDISFKRVPGQCREELLPI